MSWIGLRNSWRVLTRKIVTIIVESLRFYCDSGVSWSTFKLRCFLKFRSTMWRWFGPMRRCVPLRKWMFYFERSCVNSVIFLRLSACAHGCHRTGGDESNTWRSRGNGMWTRRGGLSTNVGVIALTSGYRLFNLAIKLWCVNVSVVCCWSEMEKNNE